MVTHTDYSRWKNARLTIFGKDIEVSFISGKQKYIVYVQLKGTEIVYGVNQYGRNPRGFWYWCVDKIGIMQTPVCMISNERDLLKKENILATKGAFGTNEIEKQSDEEIRKLYGVLHVDGKATWVEAKTP